MENDLNTTQLLYTNWTAYSASVCGQILPVTEIGVDENEAQGVLLYEVPMGHDPIRLLSGELVRRITLTYYLDEVEDSDVN